MGRFESCEFLSERRTRSEGRAVLEEDEGRDRKQCTDACCESSCTLHTE